MSENKDKYPALADSAEFAAIKSVESNYRNHRYPYIKTLDLERKETISAFRNGEYRCSHNKYEEFGCDSHGHHCD